MEKQQSAEPRREAAIEKLVAAWLVIALSFAYKGCKGQREVQTNLIEDLVRKTEMLDTNKTSVGNLYSNWSDILFIDHNTENGEHYNYAIKWEEHELIYTIDKVDWKYYDKWTLDGEPLYDDKAIYSINKSLNNIIDDKEVEWVVWNYQVKDQ